MAPSLTGPQALYLYHLAKEVQASGACPACHLYVEWQADAHRIYAQVAINALTLRDGSVEQLRGHITVLLGPRGRRWTVNARHPQGRGGVDGDRRDA